LHTPAISPSAPRATSILDPQPNAPAAPPMNRRNLCRRCSGPSPKIAMVSGLSRMPRAVTSNASSISEASSVPISIQSNHALRLMIFCCTASSSLRIELLLCPEACHRTGQRTIHTAGTLLEHSECSRAGDPACCPSPITNAAGMITAWRKAGLEVRYPGKTLLRTLGRCCGGCARPPG
jgi:hypothetical protein